MVSPLCLSGSGLYIREYIDIGIIFVIIEFWAYGFHAHWVFSYTAPAVLYSLYCLQSVPFIPLTPYIAAHITGNLFFRDKKGSRRMRTSWRCHGSFYLLITIITRVKDVTVLFYTWRNVASPNGVSITSNEKESCEH